MSPRMPDEMNEPRTWKNSQRALQGVFAVTDARAFFYEDQRLYATRQSFDNAARGKMGAPSQPGPCSEDCLIGLLAEIQLGDRPQQAMCHRKSRLRAQLPPLGHRLNAEQLQLRHAVHLRVLSKHPSNDRGE